MKRRKQGGCGTMQGRDWGGSTEKRSCENDNTLYCNFNVGRRFFNLTSELLPYVSVMMSNNMEKAN